MPDRLQERRTLRLSLTLLLALTALLPMRLGAQSAALIEARQSLQRLYEDGRYRDAEPVAREALRLAEDEFGSDHPETAIGLNDLAVLYWTLDRQQEAAEGWERAWRILAEAPAPYQVLAMGVYNNLTVLLEESGRWSRVEDRYLRLIDRLGEEFGPRSELVGKAYSNLGGFYRVQGRFAEAEQHYRLALDIKRGVAEPDAASLAKTLSNLANLYEIQGRRDEALPLYEEALRLRRQTFPEGHDEIAYSLEKLAAIYRQQGRLRRAGEYYEKALASYRAAFEPHHPRVTAALQGLGSLYFEEGDYARAEALYKEVLAVRRGAGRSPYPAVSAALIDLANLYWHQQRYGEAEPLYEEALAIVSGTLPADHPEVALALNALASLYYSQNRFEEALELARQSSDIYRQRAARSHGRRQGMLAEQKKNRHVFLLHALATLGVAAESPAERQALLAEGFEVGQLAVATSSAVAVAEMAARFAAGGSEQAPLVRRRQDAVRRWVEIDQDLLAALSTAPEERDLAAEAGLRDEAAALDAEIRRLDSELADSYPEYAELMGRRSVPMARIQSRLEESEAMVAFAVWQDRTFVWGLRRDRAHGFYALLGQEKLEDLVFGRIRPALELTPGMGHEELPAFDVEAAHTLYQELLAPLGDLLAGARRLYVVPDGPLTSLPMGLLLTERPAPPGALSEYRGLAWLARRFALTVLPAASSLEALRRFGSPARGSKLFLGVGDPLLEGAPGVTAGVGDLFGSEPEEGAGVDPEVVRQMARLPDTADELRAIAEGLMVPEDTLLLGARASESVVRGLELRDYRIVHFATHGLVAGELPGLPGPALVLTPPERATETDDGLLTAGEVAHLRLAADWVVLSACNTAAAEGAGGEGLSGLAKAFFYAGSRALLVSHWAVPSRAAVRLTTGMFAALEDEPEMGRAEALQRSMLALAADEGDPWFAHPLYWAPFEVVGEGGPIAAVPLEPQSVSSSSPR